MLLMLNVSVSLSTCPVVGAGAATRGAGESDNTRGSAGSRQSGGTVLVCILVFSDDSFYKNIFFSIYILNFID